MIPSSSTPIPWKSSQKRFPKRTKGCLTCRKRRVKCDEQRPICDRCIRGYHVCEYDDRTVFVDCTYKNSQQRHQLGCRDECSGNETRIESVPRDLSLQGFKSEMVMSFLIVKLFDSVSPSSSEHPISNLLRDRDSTAYTAGLCLAEGFFSASYGLTDMKLHAAILYGQALNKLKIDLGARDPLAGSPRLTMIWSALFLGVYNMISADSISNWLKHCEGVAALTQMTGPQGFQQNAAKPILQINRTFISIGALIHRKRSFLEQDEWKQLPWALEPMSKTIAFRLQDILCDIPGLMEDIDALSISNSHLELLTLIVYRLCSAFEELDRLRVSWNLVYPKACWESKRDSLSEPETDDISDYSTDRIYSFSSLERAIEFVYFNTTHLLLHSLLRQLKALSDECAFGLTSFNKTNGSHGTSPLILCDHDNRHHNAMAICRCIDYMMNNQRGSSGAFNLLFPLKVAYNHLHNFPATQKWVANVMMEISTRKGIFIGSQILGSY